MVTMFCGNLDTLVPVQVGSLIIGLLSTSTALSLCFPSILPKDKSEDLMKFKLDELVNTFFFMHTHKWLHAGM